MRTRTRIAYPLLWDELVLDLGGVRQADRLQTGVVHFHKSRNPPTAIRHPTRYASYNDRCTKHTEAISMIIVQKHRCPAVRARSAAHDWRGALRTMMHIGVALRA